MSLENTALPTDGNVAAGEPSQTDAATTTATEQTGEQVEGQAKPEGDGEQTKKPEKTQEQREIDRLRRRVDNLTRQKYELSARATPQREAEQRQTQVGDDETVTLRNAELKQLIAERAEKLAPSIAEQRAETERRQGVVQSLAKTWGQEEFDAKASELDEVFNGLADAQGRPKPATDAIFEADDPKGVIEYLTDPDNVDEAERIARLPSARAVREIVRIEQKLKDAKAEAKPKPSNAAKPLEAVKGGGVPNGMPDPANTKAYIAWANAQDRAAR